MKHKHYEMIVAKAENMDLVVFVKREDSDWYLRANQDITAFSNDNEYFLCLPKHKEACLHWLNGGNVETRLIGIPRYNSAPPFANAPWVSKRMFMSDQCDIRMKPRKERRWIVVIDGIQVAASLYRSLDEAKTKAFAPGGHAGWQFIEIEVEV